MTLCSLHITYHEKEMDAERLAIGQMLETLLEMNWSFNFFGQEQK